MAQRAAMGGQKSSDMWRTRHQRAKHSATVVREPGADPDVFYAGFMGNSKNYGSGKPNDDGLQDQNVPQTEHIGIEEYLSKKERERIAAEKAAAERAAAEESAFSMTAIKYETGDESSSEQARTKGKQAGFKP